MATIKKRRAIRPLSYLDVFHSSLQALHMNCGTVITCRYRLPEALAQGDSIDAVRDTFYRALALTVLEHPLLQVGLLNADSRLPSWVELDAIDLSWHVNWETVGVSKDYDARLREATTSQLHDWFGDLETRPGWRLFVLQKEGHGRNIDVILCWNHSHFDGVSGKRFHETLLRNLNDTEANQDVPNLGGTMLRLDSVADRFPRPLEKLRRYPVTLCFTLATAWRELKPPFLVSRDNRHAAWSPMSAKPFMTESQTFIVDGKTVQNVLKACRTYKTTMTGLLHALMLASLALQLRRNNDLVREEVETLYSTTPIDLRRFMPSRLKKYPLQKPRETIDNKTTLNEHYFDEHLIRSLRSKAEDATSEREVMAKLEGTVWSVASRIREEIQRKLEADMKNDVVGLMKYVRDWRTEHRSKMKKPRVGAWNLSNLGVLDGGDTGGARWGIERASFHLSANVTASVFMSGVVSVKGRELCVDVMWQEGAVDRRIGERLAEDMEGWMRYLGSKAEEGANG